MGKRLAGGSSTLLMSLLGILVFPSMLRVVQVAQVVHILVPLLVRDPQTSPSMGRTRGPRPFLLSMINCLGLWRGPSENLG